MSASWSDLSHAEIEAFLTDGYGEAALRQAFELVQNPDDWKAEISALIPADLVPIVCSAVRFFTATEATTRPADAVPNGVWVEAIGYRMGPAGP
jgi:hypothetical protein